VIADHLFHWPSGGFVGVDVFFVISGFLITGILLREHQKTGTISFVGFYRRRVKRILPAATVVLIVTAAVAWLLFNQARAGQTVVDAIWSFFFAGNWHFAAVGIDYFAAAGPESPLQHYWSLSVEEQFYFVWPWLMLAVLALGAARGAQLRRRVITGAVMGIVVVASFGWALWETYNNPTVAYFSTFTRAWELGVGALLAIGAPLYGRLSSTLRSWLAWLGLVGIVASMFVISDSTPFPAPWALLPVLATALVIAAGTGATRRGPFPLTNPLSFYIGDISYSLYLWHFPVIIFIGVLLPPGSVSYAVALVLMFGIAILSFHLVERPVQQSPWLEKGPPGSRASRRRSRAHSWRRWRQLFGRSYAWGTVSIVVVASIVMVPFALASSAPANDVAAGYQPREDIFATPTPGDSEAPVAALGPEVSAVANDISQSLSLSSWPETDPTLDFVLQTDEIPAGVARCGDLTILPVEECTFGGEGATKTAVLVGDSVAMAWVPALLPLLAEGDWKLVVRAMYGCPFVDVKKADDAEKMAACELRKLDAVATVQDLAPNLVVVSNTYELPLGAAAGGKMSPSVWESGLGRLLDDMNGAPVVVVSAPPADVDIKECYSPLSGPQDCTSTVSDEWQRVAAAEQRAAEKRGGTYVDTSVLFCAEGLCPPTTRELPVKRDIAHITMAYAERISPALQELLRERGIQ
jgi:peptidoglycan/LPS O-acetylase OafA/YrhL